MISDDWIIIIIETCHNATAELRYQPCRHHQCSIAGMCTTTRRSPLYVVMKCHNCVLAIANGVFITPRTMWHMYTGKFSNEVGNLQDKGWWIHSPIIRGNVLQHVHLQISPADKDFEMGINANLCGKWQYRNSRDDSLNNQYLPIQGKQANYGHPSCYLFSCLSDSNSV